MPQLNDFKNVMEEVSGVDLNQFFKQWLYSSGHPVLSVQGKATKKNIRLEIQQTQFESVFIFPLTVEFTHEKW